MRKHNKKDDFIPKRPGTGLEVRFYGSLVGKIKGRCESDDLLDLITLIHLNFIFKMTFIKHETYY